MNDLLSIVGQLPPAAKIMPRGVAQEARGGNRRARPGHFCYTGSGRKSQPDLRAKENEIMINLTPVATTKIKEIMSMQNPSPVALRIGVVGGGCSGFQYHMAFETQSSEADNVLEFEGLKVVVDQMSSMYLDGVEVDYIESLEGAGFKFNNPNVKSTCGCGSSFSA
jgi:iron-sulfur cluster assembly accessory protein